MGRGIALLVALALLVQSDRVRFRLRQFVSRAEANLLEVNDILRSTSAAPALTTAARARRMVSPPSQTSSTIRTRWPRTTGGTSPKTAGVSRTDSLW